MTDETGAEPPLDPAFEKVRRKMVRLLAISIAVLFVGLIAVLSAVVYRTADTAPTTGEAAGEETGAPITLPQGARILETSLSADRILIRVATGDGEEILLVDRATGSVAARYQVLFGSNAQNSSAP